MKFFTYKRWQALQGRRFEEAEHAWQANAAKYRQAFDRLRPSLGNGPHRFFRTTGLHDGFLIGIEDRGAKKMRLVVQKHDEMFILEFRDVRRLTLDYRSTGADPASLFEWGYEEFSKVSPSALRLEVLFSSGATLLIEFSKLKVSRNLNM